MRNLLNIIKNVILQFNNKKHVDNKKIYLELKVKLYFL